MPPPLHPASRPRSSPAAARAALLVALGAAALAGAGNAARGQWTVTVLGPVGQDSSANGGVGGAGPDMSGGLTPGAQVGYVLVPVGTTGQTQYHAAIWNGTAVNWVDLHPPGAASSIAFSVAQVAGVVAGRKSVVVGGVAVLGGYHAAMWPSGGGTVGGVPVWNDLNPAGANASLALCVIADGGAVGTGTTEVGFATFGFLDHAGMWSGTGAQWTDLHPTGPNWIGLTHSHAVACDANQQVGYATIGTWHATVWSGSASSAVDLHPPGSTRSECAGVSGGVQVGNAIIGGQRHATLWRGTPGSMVDLHPVQATASVSTSITGPWQAGDVTIAGIHHASIWNGSAATWVDISPALGDGWGDSFARGIWRDGTTLFVAGEAINTQSGREVAILWRKTICCPADFDCSGGPVPVSVADIFDFIGAWFAGDPRADVNGVNGIDVQDIFDFLTAWFAGC